MTIEVLKPGLQTTVQDKGRYGLQQYGVIVSGAMDTISYQIGNLLLQQEDYASLEMTLLGPTLKFHCDTTIAITGGSMAPLLNGVPCPMWRAVMVKCGDVLKFSSAQKGVRSYLAVKGGIQVEHVLNSKSTYLKARIGGHHGRALKSGDRLPISEWSTTAPSTTIDVTNFKLFENDVTIRVLKGTEYESFTEKSLSLFEEATYTISKDADRMGYRLESDAILHLQQPTNMLSEAVTIGTVQVPPSGQPIILMADRQTTGGYPKIAQVASVDLSKLAQLPPYAKIRFKLISLDEAQQLWIKQQKHLNLLALLLN
ncbi:5-oxoprolinase subunit C family protein [Solibacillus sp. FSL H8-0538]|uniref:5-oxoprolinase subunit C family protein n=1 Tax=Solibacillus sp. FSL H8-0538 TaxID=2921400 RepID=UPI0030F56717